MKRADQAGLKSKWYELLSPHSMRAGFVTTAYRNAVPDEEIMATQGIAALPRCGATFGGQNRGEAVITRVVLEMR
jgi:hypothetical protein